MNPVYEQIGEYAKQLIVKTLLEGEKTHPGNKGFQLTASEHADHALDHIYEWYRRPIGTMIEPHDEHALTRIAQAIVRQRNIIDPCIGCSALIDMLPYCCPCERKNQYTSRLNSHEDHP